MAIPGATKERHVTDNVGSMKVELTRKELDRIDSLSREFVDRAGG